MQVFVFDDNRIFFFLTPGLLCVLSQISCPKVLLLHFSFMKLLPSTRDPELVKRIGAATALETRATGIPYSFAPCIAVSQSNSSINSHQLSIHLTYLPLQ